MSDIAGIGGAPFDPGQVSRPSDVDRQADADRRREEENERTTQATQGGNEVRRPEAADASAPATAGATQESSPANSDSPRGFQPGDTEDRVTLSSEAQQALRQDAATAPATPAAGEVDATGFEPANDTNQATRQENSTSVVNGNQDEESEQNRALGQIVDQFA